MSAEETVRSTVRLLEALDFNGTSGSVLSMSAQAALDSLIAERDALKAVLTELVEHGQGWICAIELEPGLDGEDWFARARAALDAARERT